MLCSLFSCLIMKSKVFQSIIRRKSRFLVWHWLLGAKWEKLLSLVQSVGTYLANFFLAAISVNNIYSLFVVLLVMLLLWVLGRHNLRVLLVLLMWLPPTRMQFHCNLSSRTRTYLLFSNVCSQLLLINVDEFLMLIHS